MPPPTTNRSNRRRVRVSRSRGIAKVLPHNSARMSVANARVREYWNAHIHDLDVSPHQAGSREFFADLDAYHFEKLHHLLRLVDFEAWRGHDVLALGFGAGV